ncbi:2-hydroxyacid dehydrogenase [Amphiplicatus metriothermophilus]|uniref:Lactate dehydrogenase n=1 Tax=Amphiplicatus metriothermophilus TaxID=1519374 RepID=A0A239PPD2_9PROT|nr:D-glycerate dehydrogenase [Amphiplicatus metriothermophilus]MBB5518859.1 lactate dehydrogenase-like 2-hydroxyacid dehydrogenase [Amphiplicatus metriothermophilus]SNT71988.1 Lactate dehydrogenase [Amphiplicatus metriothermophilus]
MTRPLIATPRRLPGALAGILRAKYDVREPDGETVICLSEFAAIAEGASVVFATAFDEMDAAFIRALPASVKLVASIGVGVDHIDLAAARRRGIMVSNTPEVTTPCLADAAMGLVIAACRRFREGLAIAETGEGRGMLTPDSWGLRVSGRTLGIVGMGNVGRAVAKRASAFDMEIIYTTPHPSVEIDREFSAHAVSLDELLRTADIVTLHCPLKEETRHLIDAEALAKMKPTAVLINISRGPVVDEEALIEALRSRRLFAAGLDVYETEPGPIRKELRSLPNVFCLPHIASATIESRRDMALRLLANIDAFFETGAPLDRAD